MIGLLNRWVFGRERLNDMLTSQLQEEVHEAQRKIAGQEEEIVKLKAALASRPRNPDARVLELQQELQGFKLIAGELPHLYDSPKLMCR
jgi:hypothetical protein